METYKKICNILFVTALGLGGLSVIICLSICIYNSIFPPVEPRACLYRLYENGDNGEIIFYQMDSLQTKRMGAIELVNDTTIQVTGISGESIQVQVNKKYIRPSSKMPQL